MVADDVVGTEGGEAAEEQENPVLGRFDREVEGEADSEDGREDVETIEAGEGAVERLRSPVGKDVGDAEAREVLHEVRG
jgi:hypothetical protein